MQTIEQQEKIIEKLQKIVLDDPSTEAVHDLSVAVNSLAVLHTLPAEAT